MQVLAAAAKLACWRGALYLYFEHSKKQHTLYRSVAPRTESIHAFTFATAEATSLAPYFISHGEPSKMSGGRRSSGFFFKQLATNCWNSRLKWPANKKKGQASQRSEEAKVACVRMCDKISKKGARVCTGEGGKGHHASTHQLEGLALETQRWFRTSAKTNKSRDCYMQTPSNDNGRCGASTDAVPTHTPQCKFPPHEKGSGRWHTRWRPALCSTRPTRS